MPGSGVRVSPQLLEGRPTPSNGAHIGRRFAFLRSCCRREELSAPNSAFANCGKARTNFFRLLSEQPGRKALALGEAFHLNRDCIDRLLELPESVADLP